MEQYHRDLIENNLPALVSVTVDVEEIIRILLRKNVINKWMAQHILSPSEDTARKLRLYRVIQGRGPQAFSNLCKTLIEHNNINARNILMQSKQNVDRTEYSSSSTNELLNNAITDLNLINNQNIPNNEPYVKIHPERLRMDLNGDNFPTGFYHMGSKPKGRILILNMYKIIGKSDRAGSEVDLENLKKLFIGLGYIVDTHVDSTQKEAQKIIKNFSDKKLHENSDSIAVFIMSHGEAGKNSARSSDILTSDGLKINTDWIIEQFGPHNISKNIPKLFFIQACRGKNSDHGWRLPDAENNRLQNDSTNLPIGTIINRRYENVFIAYATVPGYNAKRDPKDGSWFVQKLCQVFREHAWQYDLNKMMAMVDEEVKKLNSITYGFQTVEWTHRGFNKLFYFNPGLYDDNDNDNNLAISKT